MKWKPSSLTYRKEEKCIYAFHRNKNALVTPLYIQIELYIYQSLCSIKYTVMIKLLFWSLVYLYVAIIPLRRLTICPRSFDPFYIERQNSFHTGVYIMYFNYPHRGGGQGRTEAPSARKNSIYSPKKCNLKTFCPDFNEIISFSPFILFNFSPFILIFSSGIPPTPPP